MMVLNFNIKLYHWPKYLACWASFIKKSIFSETIVHTNIYILTVVRHELYNYDSIEDQFNRLYWILMNDQFLNGRVQLVYLVPQTCNFHIYATLFCIQHLKIVTQRFQTLFQIWAPPCTTMAIICNPNSIKSVGSTQYGALENRELFNGLLFYTLMLYIQ